jgi:hypothetical protein
MRHRVTIKHVTLEKPDQTVSKKNYKKLLNNAGFSNHKNLTGNDIEVNEVVDVKPHVLGDAYRALEMKKKEDSFERHHLSVTN